MAVSDPGRFKIKDDDDDDDDDQNDTDKILSTLGLLGWDAPHKSSNS